MIDLPFNPDAFGDDTRLGRYLRADPARIHVLSIICDTLDDDGRVGDRARYYVARNPFRREVLRQTLRALAIPLPSWLYRDSIAAAANREFIARYRHGHNERQRRWNSTIPPGNPAHSRKIFSARQSHGHTSKDTPN